MASGEKLDKNANKANKDDFEMDILKCEGIIRSSFKFDYNYDPYELDYLHWYDFYNDLANLSQSEFGTCCMYNRVTGILSQKASDIKDSKERKKLVDAQKLLKKKYCKEDKEKKLSNEEKTNVADLYKEIGLWKGE